MRYIDKHLAMAYHCLYFHLVFRTYESRPTIPLACNSQLEAYFREVCKKHHWYMEAFNANFDHVHLLISIRPVDTPALVVKEIKVSSSQAFKGNKDMLAFDGWSKGYGLFSISRWDVDKITQYIANQQYHHNTQSTSAEFHSLLLSHGVDEGGFFDSNW